MLARRAAFITQCLRVSVLAVALAIARWLWSRRKKPRLEDEKLTTSPNIRSGSELFTGVMPSLPPGELLSQESLDLSESERAAISYKYVVLTPHFAFVPLHFCVHILNGSVLVSGTIAF